MDESNSQSATGVVGLREDVPLKAGSAGGVAGARCAGGPRLILACFAALSAAITLALCTQIYYGDYEVVPHGGVASSGAACSAAGTRALKAGGGALDAAAVSALCLAVLAPHLTSLDASGSLLYWEYRAAGARAQGPTLAEWGAGAGSAGTPGPRPPRLLAALAAMHARYGALPWEELLQPAINLAKNGFPVSEGLAAALAAAPPAPPADPPPPAGSLLTAPRLAAYLQSLQRNTSAELARAWGGAVRVGAAPGGAAGAWRLYAGGARAGLVLAALAAALRPPPAHLDEASARVIAALQAQAAAGGAGAVPGGVATGLAVVDSRDTYAALVTGLSVPFGSEGAGRGAGPGAGAAPEGWARDEPRAPLDLAPAILLDEHVCGTRFVLGGESHAALAQAAAALAVSGDAAAVERARVAISAGGALATEAARAAPPAAALPPLAAPPSNASAPYAAVNVVRQRGDALLSHADSRGGGIASRY